MPRCISFSKTLPQFCDGSKDVTRRYGWWKAKPGDVLLAVEKAMGLKKGEKMKKLGMIRVITARPEPLIRMLEDENYGMDEMRREGYPFGFTCPRIFVEKLSKDAGKDQSDPVMRIEFERIEDE